MGKFRDLAGSTFNSLKVIRDTGERAKNGGVFWLVECLCCGKQKRMHSASILYQNKACGCQNGEIQSSHGLSKHRLYKIWINMNSRCYLSNDIRFDHYGGRGITVCDEWIGNPEGLKNFFSWAINHEKYDDSLTLERIDVNGNYCPENCTWASWREQAQNKENTRWVNLYGERLCSTEAHRKYGKVKYETFLTRLNRGWSVEDALTKGIRHET